MAGNIYNPTPDIFALSVVGTENPVGRNSDGVSLFPCPHHVRNFFETKSRMIYQQFIKIQGIIIKSPI